ncbi:DNA topoisomerase IB [Frankia sp. AvcI1]|uniref:DNA topoisomerase IB n=2 Tax=Frankia sp. AvcI1 TaxID=573496 RepID=UPI0006EC24E8|nr:DNA topoisomerase IB [Frankia sp. AvcI1]
MARLRRSDLTAPGITRRRRGRGWSYSAPGGGPLRDSDEVARVGALAIPPAWRDVWISPWPLGHIQARGVDAAGRHQYRYHDAWQARQATAKFDRVLEVAQRLPRLREHVEEDLRATPLSRTQLLAVSVRLLDVGFFRIGGEEYVEANNSFGLTTLRREHVRVADDQMVFDYPAKSGQQRVQAVADPAAVEIIAGLLAREGAADQPLLVWHDGAGEHGVSGRDVNEYLRDTAGLTDVSAKDFRTWSATTLAAVALAVSAPLARAPSTRRRAVTRMYREVADYLGNTPAVCRVSYVHPRIVDLFLDGYTIAVDLESLGTADSGRLATQGATEAAVLDLLAGPTRRGGRPQARFRSQVP